jgi:hypothetical protein
MNKLIVIMAATVLSTSMASTAFSKEPAAPPEVCPIKGGCPDGNHGNHGGGCLNSGAGNGGEFAGKGSCISVESEASGGKVGIDQDPGNSQAHNNAPPVPPGQAKKD